MDTKRDDPLPLRITLQKWILLLTVLALLFQLFPPLWLGTLWALDIRNWPRTFWFIGNWVIALALVAFRFGPGLVDDWRKGQSRKAAERQKQQKRQELKDQRELFARMKEAQKRRIY